MSGGIHTIVILQHKVRGKSSRRSAQPCLKSLVLRWACIYLGIFQRSAGHWARWYTGVLVGHSPGDPHDGTYMILYDSQSAADSGWFQIMSLASKDGRKLFGSPKITISIWLMASTPLKHMKVSWGYYSQLEKNSSKPPTSDCGRLNLMCYLNFLRLSASGLAAGSQDLRSKGSEGASHWRRMPQSNYQP